MELSDLWAVRCLAAAGTMAEDHSVSGLLTATLCLKSGGTKKASAEMSDLANICIFFPFRGIMTAVKLHKCLRIGMRKVLNSHGIF